MPPEYRAADLLLESEYTLDHHKAIEILTELHDNGHRESSYTLGWAFYNGIGVEKNTRKAYNFYEKAASLGEPTAQVLLGQRLANKRGATDEDLRRAADLYRSAAASGSSDACFNLGYCYDIGKGVEKDSVASFLWYHSAAVLGDVDAARIVGYCYWTGSGTTEDKAIAMKYYLSAAQNGDIDAMFNLADGYRHFGDVDKSRHWFHVAASCGSEDAKGELLELSSH